MAPPTDDGFVAFYREYARTGVHAATTAALTAFGTLTIVNQWFAAVALAAYGLPPLALYARGSMADPGPEDEVDDGQAPEEPVIDWRAGRPPTDADLEAAAVTAGAAVAVGEGGTILERTGGRDPWSVSLPDDPGAGGRTLHDADATDDGSAVWAVGDGGAVGRCEDGGAWLDLSEPDGDTNNVTGVAVAGAAGAETVLLVDGGGAVRRGRYRGGDLAWDEPTTPGSGSSVAGVALDGETGYVVDTAGDAFRTTDDGRSFAPLDLDVAGTPTAVAVAPEGPAVATTEGVVHVHDGTRWRPERVADGELTALAFGDDGRAVAVDDGAAHTRVGPNEWDRVVVPAPGALRDVALGEAGVVAAGDDGTIVEQLRSTDGQ